MLLLTIAPLDIIFDVNDLLSNILGAVLGMLLMCGINRRFKGKSCREGKGLGSYMYNVCCRCGNGQKSLG